MKTIAQFALIPLLVLLLPVASPASESGDSLVKIKSFAFGGIGVAGTTSQGEKLFHAVLVGDGALTEFRKILAKGTPEAKLYALCGIRALDKASLADASAALQKENPEVETIAGCMIMKQRAGPVIRSIIDGRYDYCLQKKK